MEYIILVLFTKGGAKGDFRFEGKGKVPYIALKEELVPFYFRIESAKVFVFRRKTLGGILNKATEILLLKRETDLLRFFSFFA